MSPRQNHYADIVHRMTGSLAGLRGQDLLDYLDTLDRYVAEMRRQNEVRADREARAAAEWERHLELEREGCSVELTGRADR
jgi:hypothetical protein